MQKWSTVKQTLHHLRSDIEMQHKKWFDDAVSLGENIDASAHHLFSNNVNARQTHKGQYSY